MCLSKDISPGQEQQEHQRRRRWRCGKTAFWVFTMGFLVVSLLFGSLQATESVRASYDAYVQVMVYKDSEAAQTMVDKDLEAAAERSKSRAERNDRTVIDSTETAKHQAKGQALVVRKAVPYLDELKEHHTTRSLRHQQKFFAVKDRVLAWAKKKDDEELRNNHPTVTPRVRSASTGQFFAFNLNPDFAFLHVFKSGGTTVERQLGRKRHNTLRQVGNRTLIVSVRDPIDHFLSGWGECGERFPKELLDQQTRPNRRPEAQGSSYDDRVRSWLSFVQTNCTEGGWSLCACKAHSLPQADFLIGRHKEFFPTLGVVGDMHELPGLLELAGVSFNHSISNGRDSRSSRIKRQHFFKDLGRLSNRTLQEICRFVALDYHYFDFEPPPPCRDELRSDWAAGVAVS